MRENASREGCVSKRALCVLRPEGGALPPRLSPALGSGKASL